MDLPLGVEVLSGRRPAPQSLGHPSLLVPVRRCPRYEQHRPVSPAKNQQTPCAGPAPVSAGGGLRSHV